MSREIKFRALTKNNNVMVFGDLIGCPNGEHRIMWFELKGELPLDVDYNDFNEVVQSSTIGQFTGLIDKNGKEIYEGDIVLCDRTYWEEKKNLVVEYDSESASFYLLNKKNSVDSETFEKTSCFCVSKFEREIIGNIFQNPEML